ncbi:MAG TPA: hypothetical protein VH370_24520 [Humisphaera sp.]|jgi:hypothetical protein|nr:hypothetical protein [Humisphaera sp.]
MIRRLLTGFSLLSLLLSGLVVGEWVRSYRKTDDLFVIYNGDGSEQLRIRQGMVMFHHTSPPLGKSRDGIRRLSVNSYRDESLAASTNSPTPFVVPKVWHSFRLESLSAAEVARAQAAPSPYAMLSGSMSAGLSNEISVDRQTGSVSLKPGATGQLTAAEQVEMMRLQNALLRVRISSSSRPIGPPHWRVIFPAWPLLLIAAIPMVHLCVNLIRKRRRRSHGLCGVCAYDLTGNQSGVCPECGTAVPGKPRPA